MYTLPTEVTINGNSYPIRNGGDYRLILEIITVLNGFKAENELDSAAMAWELIIMFYDDINTVDDVINTFDDLNAPVQQIYDFINCGKSDIQAKQKSVKLIDWEQDEQLITSAINSVIKGEIRSMPYVHWWTFISYYMAIGECSLSSIVNIRHKIATGKKLEKHEKQFKRDNPQYFIFKEDIKKAKDAEKFLQDIWNKS